MIGALTWYPGTALPSMLSFFGQKPECFAKIKATAASLTAALLPDDYWPESITTPKKVTEVVMKAIQDSKS